MNQVALAVELRLVEQKDVPTSSFIYFSFFFPFFSFFDRSTRNTYSASKRTPLLRGGAHLLRPYFPPLVFSPLYFYFRGRRIYAIVFAQRERARVYFTTEKRQEQPSPSPVTNVSKFPSFVPPSRMLEDELFTREGREERGFGAEDECTEREQEKTWYPIAG